MRLLKYQVKHIADNIYNALNSSANCSSVESDGDDAASRRLSKPSDQEDNYNLLPPYSEHGRYTFNKQPSVTWREIYSSVKLDISYNTGYLNNNTIKSIFCINKYWLSSKYTCVFAHFPQRTWKLCTTVSHPCYMLDILIL